MNRPCLPLALAISLSGCGATRVLNPQPVYGVRTDPEFGRCGYAGTWVGTAPGTRVLVTGHGCVRVERGAGSSNVDAGTVADAAP